MFRKKTVARPSTRLQDVANLILPPLRRSESMVSDPVLDASAAHAPPHHTVGFLLP
jgi:hypothetical protein